jgi:hypothetical protein
VFHLRCGRFPPATVDSCGLSADSPMAGRGPAADGPNVRVALALAVLLGLALPGTLARASNPTTYTDPAGDVSGAADLTTMAISNDASGEITFTFTATGMKPGMVVDVMLDTDRNLTTGQPGTGADYVLEVADGNDGHTWDIYRWNGNTFAPMDTTPAFYHRNDDTFTLVLAAADLGTTTAFSFFALSTGADAYGNLVAEDRSPDRGTWLYKLTVPAAAPRLGLPTAVPAEPVAGKPFVVTLPVTRGKSGAPLTNGMLTSTLSIAGRTIPHSDSLEAGKARLAFTVPANAKGKVLHVQITVRAGKLSGAEAIAYKVR